MLSQHGIAACQSELLEFDERVFLQCERFDRVGDLFEGVLKRPQKLESALEKLAGAVNKK